jgi:hypothetical protein
MKKLFGVNMIYYFIGLFVLVFIICTFFLNKKNNTIKNIESIKYFHLSYSNGYMANSNTTYNINCEDKCVLELKPKYIPDEETISIELSNDEINKLIEIINKYQVIKWDGFNESDKDVLDGDSFSLSIKTKDNISVSASGYMKYPKGYSNFEKEIDELFEKYITENMKKF